MFHCCASPPPDADSGDPRWTEPGEDKIEPQQGGVVAKSGGLCHKASLRKASTALELGLHRTALRAAEAALAVDPTNEEALRHRASALAGLGENGQTNKAGAGLDGVALPKASDAPREWRPECTLGNDAKYTGEWCGTNRDGEGCQVWVDGSVFEGRWYNDKAHGRGVYRSHGSVYEGEWREGRAHGQGTFTRPDGAVYDGQWVQDAQQGHGSETWPDGAVYVGQQIAGQKHGKGRLVWKDGSTYEGQFHRNDMAKEGVVTFADGQRYEGQWSQSKMHGKGVFWWPDGTVFRGEYADDVKHGRGTLTTPDGNVETNVWARGRRQEPPSP